MENERIIPDLVQLNQIFLEFIWLAEESMKIILNPKV